MTALVGRDANRARASFAAARESGASEQQIDDLVETLVLAFGLSQWTATAWRAVDPAPRPDSADVRAQIGAHFADTDDGVPEPVEALVDRLPELARLYVDTRVQLFADEPGADPALREMLLAIVSARAGYLAGGRRHLLRAREFGLPRETLRMALTGIVLIEGATPWLAYGRQLWEAFDA